MNDKYKALEDQVRNSYSNIFWTEKIYIKDLNILKKKDKDYKTAHIVLGILTSCTSLSALKLEFSFIKWVLVFFTLLHTGLSLYLKKFKLSEEIVKFDIGRKQLWEIRELYVGLLTDIRLETEDISSLRKRIDYLTKKTSNVYAKTLETSNKAYKEAKIEIENGNYSFVDDAEIDKLLPVSLRRN